MEYSEFESAAAQAKAPRIEMALGPIGQAYTATSNVKDNPFYNTRTGGSGNGGGKLGEGVRQELNESTQVSFLE
jgi:hypothetical protein